MDNPPPMIASLDHLVLTVTDIMASVAFYRDILGMQALQFEAADGSGVGLWPLARKKSICTRHRPLLHPMPQNRVPGRRICAFCRRHR